MKLRERRKAALAGARDTLHPRVQFNPGADIPAREDGLCGASRLARTRLCEVVRVVAEQQEKCRKEQGKKYHRSEEEGRRGGERGAEGRDEKRGGEDAAEVKKRKTRGRRSWEERRRETRDTSGQNR
jgi:hypothetical protein